MAIRHFTLADLAAVVKSRAHTAAGGNVEGSYTAMVMQKGRPYAARKLMEEALEVVLASHDDSTDAVTQELGDLFYHALILARLHGVGLEDIECQLGLRHPGTSGKRTGVGLASELARYIDSGFSDTFTEVCRDYDIALGSAADVILLSHTLRASNKPVADSLCRFPNEAKLLKVKLLAQGLKVKMGTPRGVREEYRSRRDKTLLLPICFVMNAVVLPLCMNVIAAYLKDWLDGRGSQEADQGPDIEVCIGLKDNDGGESKWYSIKGSPAQVYRALKMIRRKKG